MTELRPCPFCGKEARLIDAECGTTIYAVECVLCQAKIGWFDEKERAIEAWNERPNPWHTGTPTEKGLYVVLTKVSMKDVSSSEGTYILDYWDGYAFQYLKRKALVYFPIAPDTYGWVKWQKIEPYKEN